MKIVVIRQVLSDHRIALLLFLLVRKRVLWVHREVHRWFGNTSLFSSGYVLSVYRDVDRWFGNMRLFSSGYEEGALAPL